MTRSASFSPPATPSQSRNSAAVLEIRAKYLEFPVKFQAGLGAARADNQRVLWFWRDHAPPHFHALYAEDEALIDIRTLELIRGALPKRALALVLEWASEHRAELMENWELCRRMQSPKQITPLR